MKSSAWSSIFVLAVGVFALVFLVAIDRQNWFHIRPATGTAGQGHVSNDGRTNPANPALPYRSREKEREERGLPPCDSLQSLARTYLETQARLWPELAGTPAVPTGTDAVVEVTPGADGAIGSRVVPGAPGGPNGPSPTALVARARQV